MNLKSKLEDITFSVIQHLPIIPSFLMNWADNYLNRRIAELNHETNPGISQHAWRTYRRRGKVQNEPRRKRT